MSLSPHPTVPIADLLPPLVQTGRWGQFHNARENYGFSWVALTPTRRFGLPRQRWLFELDKVHPLTWEDSVGFWRTGNIRLTDGGSEPSLIRPWLPEAQFPCSYSLHDDAWGDHAPDGGMGLYFSETLDGEYDFRALSRWESNRMLGWWVDAEGATDKERKAILIGVAVGAVFAELGDISHL